MQTIEFHLDTEYVELCNLLKLVGLADSGGRGKTMVAEGLVRVDSKPESRKTAKIRVGQMVECTGTRILVIASTTLDLKSSSQES
ncbi:MAG TPA: RNA-binding S4 domain-containing protein [Methylophilaceae bacterium]|nr:RNA-binding S4 domain-containing protein [Methylophilaceae bacterium]